MTVLSADLIWDSREGYEALYGEKEATLIYRVITDDPNDDHTDILASGLVPRVGTVHPKDSSLLCIKSYPRNESVSRLVWLCTTVWSNKKYNPGGDVLNPLNDPAEIEWNTEHHQVAAEEDHNGYAITNSAGDAFIPPPMKDDSRVAAIITKNVPSAAALTDVLLNYRDAVNSDQFDLDGITVEPLVAKMSRVKLSKKRERNDIEFRIATFVIHLKGDTWTRDILDRGFRQLDDNGDPKFILAKDGSLVPQPVLLDGTGKVLDPPSPVLAAYIPYDLETRKQFTPIAQNFFV